jgi:hypothetical protein
MYTGQTILIQLGEGGLFTDHPQSRIPPTKLIEARDITLTNGYVEKAPGSKRWNQTNNITGDTTVSSGINAFAEFFPSPDNQRVIVLGSDGTLYKFNSPYERITLTPETGSVTPLTMGTKTHIAIGGNEAIGKNKKAFIFTGLSQVQVVDGDAITYRAIKTPAADWSSSYPTYGFVYRSRLWCFGNTNLPDFLYCSTFQDFENFTTGSSDAASKYFDVFPGEGDGIIGAFVFKNRLFICKRPGGLYQLNDDSVSPSNWYFTRVNADIGLASAHSVAQMFDDALLFNNQGTATILSAAFQFGNIKSADLFNNAGVERYFRLLISGYGLKNTQALYYPDRKQVYFTAQSKSGSQNDTVIVLDMFNKESQISVNDKDQPNYLGLIQDDATISRPYYASSDGNIYSLDAKNRAAQYTFAGQYVVDGYMDSGYVVDASIGGYAYNMIAQTPHFDFGFADPAVGLKTKRFEFLELTFQPTGDWSVTADIYIDSEFKESIDFNLLRDHPLGVSGYTKGFQLDVDRLDADTPKSVRKPLHGQGRTISIKLRSDGFSQDIKLQSMMIYFKVSDERQIKDLRT